MYIYIIQIFYFSLKTKLIFLHRFGYIIHHSFISTNNRYTVSLRKYHRKQEFEQSHGLSGIMNGLLYYILYGHKRIWQ